MRKISKYPRQHAFRACHNREPFRILIDWDREFADEIGTSLTANAGGLREQRRKQEEALKRSERHREELEELSRLPASSDNIDRVLYIFCETLKDDRQFRLEQEVEFNKLAKARRSARIQEIGPENPGDEQNRT
jgi:hypothetical protein